MVKVGVGTCSSKVDGVLEMEEEGICSSRVVEEMVKVGEEIYSSTALEMVRVAVGTCSSKVDEVQEMEEGGICSSRVVEEMVKVGEEIYNSMV
jgi:hypothetical protein